jgi:peptidoglycan hydrolase-like protein with peptidoglycan-binding domain
MRSLLCKRNLGGLVLAALTAGTLTVPAVFSQSTSTPPKKSAKSTSSGSSTTHAKSLTAGNSSHSASSKRSTRGKTKKVKGQAAPTPERISEIQEALSKKGVLAGAPSGKWDDSTIDAMKKFQTSNGLNPSGKLDALTLEKLGLGSETAGLARPVAPPNSSNRLRNQSSQPQEPDNSN